MIRSNRHSLLPSLYCFYYSRVTILPSEDKVVSMFDRISKFHKEFMEKFRDDGEEKHSINCMKET